MMAVYGVLAWAIAGAILGRFVRIGAVPAGEAASTQSAAAG